MMGTRSLVPSPMIAGLKFFIRGLSMEEGLTTFYSKWQDWKLPKEVLSFSPPLVSRTRCIESSWHRHFPVIGSKGITGSFPWECMSIFHSSTWHFSNYFPHSCSTQGTPRYAADTHMNKFPTLPLRSLYFGWKKKFKILTSTVTQ